MIMKTRQIPDGKKEIKEAPVTHYLEAKYLYYPITSARCMNGICYTDEGQYVKVGELIGLRNGPFFEQPIHSTVSGKVVGIEKKLDSSGQLRDSIVIENDFKYEYHESIIDRTEKEIEALKKEDYIEIAKNYGLVGLGGSAFPTYIKLNSKDPIHTIVANGVECEPNLVSDYELMLGEPELVIQGLIYTMKASGATRGVIAVKKKYPHLIAVLEEAAKAFNDYEIIIAPVGTYYPQGWELETIKSAIGVTVPQGQLTSKYGILVFNVSSLVSIYNAVKHRRPVLERYFTITGEGAHNMKFRARIGTMISELVALAGGYKELDHPKVLVLGGPMMGSNVETDEVVMTLTSTSLIVYNNEEKYVEACIHCAACVYSCPVKIQPVQIMNAYKRGDKDALLDLKVNNCIECGLCSYVCPSKIYLTDYMRLGKGMLKG